MTYRAGIEDELGFGRNAVLVVIVSKGERAPHLARRCRDRGEDFRDVRVTDKEQVSFHKGRVFLGVLQSSNVFPGGSQRGVRRFPAVTLFVLRKALDIGSVFRAELGAVFTNDIGDDAVFLKRGRAGVVLQPEDEVFVVAQQLDFRLQFAQFVQDLIGLSIVADGVSQKQYFVPAFSLSVL